MRGRNYAEALVRQAEYAPPPPIDAGTLETVSLVVSEMAQMMFAPAIAEFEALAE
ncbi:hypothetical protein [Altererythrobacter sp. MTPC7]|uniref:hypothetical protein n=1 Tax=Altererythrobacter sp. MTPC7 TaxID=3056567 RepID=UPI0036F2E415